MRRLHLVRHAPTDAVRSRGFPGPDDALHPDGRAAARALAPAVATGWPHDVVLVSPRARATETAELLRLASPTIVDDLREADFGTWAGRTLAEIHDEDPGAATTWMEDPSAAPHGGESLHDVRGRVGGWLAQEAGRDGAALAVTHGGIVKACVVEALDAPDVAFWRVTAHPLHVTTLVAHDGTWSVEAMNVPLALSPHPPS